MGIEMLNSEKKRKIIIIKYIIGINLRRFSLVGVSY